MELVLATFKKGATYLRIQPSHGTGGWWLYSSEDVKKISEADYSTEDFVLKTEQDRKEPLEILARGLLDGW